jgi:hypothetical protein
MQYRKNVVAWFNRTESTFCFCFLGKSPLYFVSFSSKQVYMCAYISTWWCISAHACTFSTDKVTTFYSIIVLRCHGHLTGKLLLRMIKKSSWKKEMAQDLSFTFYLSRISNSQFVSRCSCAWSFQVYTPQDGAHARTGTVLQVAEHLCIQLTYACMEFMPVCPTILLWLWLWAKTLFKPSEICVWTIRPRPKH